MEHESFTVASDEWYTPPEIFRALGESYDLDPCHAGNVLSCTTPAARKFTKVDNGLALPWHGFVFVNPPYGGRNGHVPWLRRFIDHGNGIALVRAYTSAGWFHDYVAKSAHALVFPRGKTKFVRPDGSIGKAPGSGVVLMAIGERGIKALERSQLGLFVRLATNSETGRT